MSNTTESGSDYHASLLHDENTLLFLRLIIGLVLAGGLAYLVTALLATGEGLFRSIGALAVLLSASGALVLYRQGRIGAAAQLLVWGIWLSMLLQIFISNGLMSRSLMALPIIIMLAGWLLPPRGALALCLASLLAGLILALGEQGGVLPLKASPSPPQLVWLAYSIYVVLAAALAFFIFRGFRLRQASLHRMGEDLSAQVDRLSARETELRQSESKFASVFRSSPLAVAITRIEDGRYLDVNDAFVRLFGWSREEAIGRTSLEMGKWATPEARAAWAEELRLAGRVSNLETDFRTRAGEVRRVLISAEMIVMDGEPCALVMTADITERLQAEAALRESEARLNAELEARVRERTAELRAANRELESFAYSISHDLRAPLRGIDGFCHLLAEEYAERLDDTGRDYLDRVRRAAQRMGNLIDDILELSRVTRLGMRRAAVDLNELAREFLDERARAEPEHKVQVIVASDCTAFGDPQLLRVLMQNLLENAWKYSAREPHPKIEFGCAAENGDRVFFVRDNGVGFDMKYADRLFAPFQRLHKPEEFEGTGIGLATVARVVHRHGGRIWAESEPGQGALFRFTLGQSAAESQ